ncbi:MAG: hypothetical protein WA624_17765, partial [Methylocella sp.]
MANILRVCHCRKMLWTNWRERTPKISGRIAFRAARRDGIAEYLPANLPRPMRGLGRAPTFNSAQHRQQFGRGHVRN